jgi:lipid II:glycine glycyltransferase (peptidoglycan interpeptide bridge formation enzyme)
MEGFRLLHRQAAGRETRSRKTWDLEYEMVLQGEAFVVLAYLEQALVTAALFLYSPRYCYYGVSASNRDLFDKPLSHIVLWTAILHAKGLGCRFFEMGKQLYPGQGDPLPTQKELNISTFKRGFGGKTQIRLDVVWKRLNEKE